MKNRQKEIIASLSDRELLLNFYISQLLICILAVILAFFLFDSFIEFLHLFDFHDYRIVTVGGSAGVFVVIMDLLLMKFLPASYYDDGGINERIFKNRGFFTILFMCIIIAFCEEILFRGVIQTKFGLIIASTIFAFVHYRYLYNWFLFVNIVLLSFFIGMIYEMTDNLAVPLFMHFIIDFLLALFVYKKAFQKHV